MAKSPSERYYRDTLDSLLEGFQIIGRDWRYVYINPAAAEQGKSTPDALAGRVMWEAYPGLEKSPLFPVLERCMNEKKGATLENLFTYPDGHQRWFELRIEPVPEGLCIHSFDIHERRSAQDALHRMNTELEARVAERTRTLNDLNGELESFAHSVSHDLRAPLRHVNGFASMLAEDAAARLTTGDTESLKRIIGATERMTAMIDALLAFSKLGRTPLEKQPVDLAGLVADVRADLTPDVGARSVAWSVGTLPIVHADPALLKLVMTNLMSNAVKYTRVRAPAEIAIGCDIEERTGEQVVWVRDNGVGFDMADAGKLFGVFQRLHRAEDFEGTGIGLANVRRIITRHGGRTWADSTRGSGACFFFSLP